MPRRQKADLKVKRLRNTIMALVALVAVVIIGYGIVYSTGITEGDYQAGTHYDVIDEAPPRRPGEPIRVQEFFSYGCVHCRNFDPMIERWKQNLPEGVVFERTPVAFSPAWTLLAQTYYALDELGALERNHDRLFRAIHDSGRQFLTVDSMADFVAGQGTSREQFLQVFDSESVRRQVREAERQQRAMRIASVPTMVVAGRYRVGMDVGRKTALDVTDHLIEQELAARR
ncbi:MAG: thiol:disulfide interchange protein DsbA/DsbL [Pseudomonadales bacterium]